MKAPIFPILIFFGLLSLSPADTAVDQQDITSSSGSPKVRTFDEIMAQLRYTQLLSAIGKRVQVFKTEIITSNVTMLGSQNVYNEDGSVKEIRTIELSIPQIQQKSVISDGFNLNENNLDGDHDDDLDNIRKLRHKVTDLSLSSGFDVDVAYMKKNKYRDTIQDFYLSKDLLVSKNEGVCFVNKTIYLDIFGEIPQANCGTGPSSSISTLAFDNEGVFLKDKSNVVPEFFATVESAFDNPKAAIIRNILKSLVNTVLETEIRDDIPENLRQHLEQLYPDLVFTVTRGEPIGSYINKDFSVHLNYDYLDLEENLKYSVYGYNRTAASA